MSYEAIVTQLTNVRPFDGADKILLANAIGYQVVVGLGAKEGDLVVCFGDDGQLSSEYASANNLIGVVDPITKVRTGGFFSANRRVKAQSFRKQKSEAYVASLESLSFTGYDISKLKIGDKFDILNNIPICNKYFTPATKKSMLENKVKSNKAINAELKKLFPEHKDTEQLRFANDDQLKGLVTISGKLHGTSARTGHIFFPTETEMNNPFKKLWNCFVDEVLHGKRHILNFWTNDEKASNLKFYPKVNHSYEIIHGTRRVCKGIVNPKSHDYRSISSMKLAPFIEKGEIWYYEIVGYEDTGASIMQTVATEEMGKEFVKRFGKSFTYKYSCLQGTCEIYVYRITSQNTDGIIYELPWNVVKSKCINAGIKHVPEIETLLVKTDYDIAKFKEKLKFYTDESDIAEPIDPSHIKEGYCVRVENLETGRSTIWKEKLFAFKVLEGIVKNSDNYVDTEEIEGYIDNELVI